MIIKQRRYSIQKLVADKDQINLNPTWQRGAAWRLPRQLLLIDSILRGVDLPKIYLRTLPHGGPFSYDAVDGQQRLRAIWMFRNDEINLTHPDILPDIDGHAITDLRYSNLPLSLKDRFDRFIVSVARIDAATQDEISVLFSRLQMGVSLNPAELRNAIIAPMRNMIDAIATSHPFFENSRIPGSRYKRQDYTAHVFAMAAYECTRDIKAPDLKDLVLEYGPDRYNEVLEISAKIGDALNVLADVNELSKGRITQKWIFADLCWLVMQRQIDGAQVDPHKLFRAYNLFEDRRRQFTSAPEQLLQGARRSNSLDRHLYNYIIAFRIEGARSSNLLTRALATRAYCPDIDART